MSDLRWFQERAVTHFVSDGISIAMGRRITRVQSASIALILLVAACGGTSATTTEALLGTDTTRGQLDEGTTAAPTTTGGESSTTTTTTEAPETFVFDRQARFGPGEPEWDSNFVVPGALIEHDGLLYMFYNGSDFQGTTLTRSAVGVATSDDGVFFGRLVDEPLFDGADRDWTGRGAIVSSGHVLEDGTWALYFHTLSRAFSQRGGVVGRATAPRPEGPWTVDAEPLLVPGADTAWDAEGLSHPSVVPDGAGGYFMYYDAHRRDEDVRPDRLIGMATSSDGVTWVKHDDPATTDELYAASDPVLGFGEPGAFDELRTMHPSVIVTDDGYVMVYMSNHKGQRPGLVWEFGIARSDDGVTWTRGMDPPFFSTKNLFGYLTSSTFTEFNGEWLVLVDGAGSIQSPSNGIFRLARPAP